MCLCCMQCGGERRLATCLSVLLQCTFFVISNLANQEKIAFMQTKKCRVEGNLKSSRTELPDFFLPTLMTLNISIFT